MKKAKILKSFFLNEIPIQIINIVTSILPNHFITNRVRGFLMTPFFGRCGKRLQIGKGVIINNPRNLYIGDDCYISHYCYIQAKGEIRLEDSVIIGPMSIIASSNHIFVDGLVTNKGISSPIIIGKGSWCGGHVVISSGVSVGMGVMIGAGAVVTKDFGNDVKIGGVPASVIGKLR